MILKKANYKNCEKCNHSLSLISNEVRGCDVCKKRIKNKSIHVNIFNYKGIPYFIEVCNWKCLIKYIKKRKKLDFVEIRPWKDSK